MLGRSSRAVNSSATYLFRNTEKEEILDYFCGANITLISVIGCRKIAWIFTCLVNHNHAMEVCSAIPLWFWTLLRDLLQPTGLSQTWCKEDFEKHVCNWDCSNFVLSLSWKFCALTSISNQSHPGSTTRQLSPKWVSPEKARRTAQPSQIQSEWPA
jgi:hypothetical protein